MPIYVFPGANNECSIHYQPELLTLEEKSKGIELQELPTPEIIVGKRTVLKGDLSTGQAWYEYIDKPDMETDLKITQLEQGIAELTILIAMLGGGTSV